MLSLFVVPGTSRLLVPAAAGVAPGASARLPFRWPGPKFVTGLLVLSDDGNPATCASLGVSIVDETADLLTSDGRGTIVSSAAGDALEASAALLLLQGQGFQPLPLQRPIRGGDRWLLTIQNRSAGAIRLAGVMLYVEDEDLP